LIADPRPLLRAIVVAFMVLENSPDDEVDPSVAVRAMENMTHEILAMTSQDQASVRALFAEMANEEREPGRKFISELPDQIGLAK
jgi:hypothetical protein